jgi:hypothetical protein
MYLVFPLGWLISHAILATIFFLILTPIGLVARLVRHDPMERRTEPSKSSYWTQRRQEATPERYLRQF